MPTRVAHRRWQVLFDWQVRALESEVHFHTMIPSEETIEFDPQEREAFRAGDLREEWARTYPQIFDEHDLRLARSQPNYHFYEWYAAISIFRRTGELSLVEQYPFPDHPRKRTVVARLVPPQVQRVLWKAPAHAPDLLVYAADFSDWYFCEVQSPADQISAAQLGFFSTLELVGRKPICVLKLVSRVG